MSGPVDNSESYAVHRKSNSINQIPNSKFISLSLSNTSLVLSIDKPEGKSRSKSQPKLNPKKGKRIFVLGCH